jgi:hypothetical protein
MAAPAAAPANSMRFQLAFIGACFLWLGVHNDAFQALLEQPFLASRGATLQDFAAASSVEDIPWSSKLLYALPLDAGFCFSRVCGVNLGLRRPMIFVGQALALTFMAVQAAIDPVTLRTFYQFSGFARMIGVVFVAISIEGYATDASISVFAGRESLPAAALQIGRNLGAAVGALAGGRLSETQGFGAMFALFLAMTAATVPLIFFARELRPVPLREAASAPAGLLAALQRLVPLRLILAWSVRPPVLAFAAIMCVANVGGVMGSLFKTKFWQAAKGASLSEVGQLYSVLSVTSLVANAPVAVFIDRCVKTRLQMTMTLVITMLALAAYSALPLATPDGAAALPALYAIEVFGGIANSLYNVIYFAVLLRLADKRLSATAFSIFTMVTNAFGGPVPKQISIVVLDSTPGGDVRGVERCMWIGAVVGACAALLCPLLVLPSVEEQLKLDGLGAEAVGAGAGAGGVGGGAGASEAAAAERAMDSPPATILIKNPVNLERRGERAAKLIAPGPVIAAHATAAAPASL